VIANVVAACVRRDLTIARTYRLAFTLEAIAVIAGLAIFAGIGHVVEDSRIARETGVPGGYFAFASVGIAVSGVLNVCCSAFARRIREDQTTGAFEAMLSMPTSPKLLVVAGAAYELARALVLALLTLLVAVLLFGVDLRLHGSSALALLVALPALMVALAAVGIAVASVGVVFKDPGPVVALATAGVALLSGAYFPIAVLPEPLDAIAKVVPFTWGLDALRGGLLGGHVAAWKCFGLVGVAIVALPCSLWLFERAIDAARRRGSLGQY
jgi:ABC-2 type transport system permease protein